MRPASAGGHRLPVEIEPLQIFAQAIGVVGAGAPYARRSEQASAGVPTQTVGDRATSRMAGFLASRAAVGPYLADQLLLPMALAGGGRFTMVKPSQHARTAADVIVRFLPVRIAFDQADDGVHHVTVDRLAEHERSLLTDNELDRAELLA